MSSRGEQDSAPIKGAAQKGSLGLGGAKTSLRFAPGGTFMGLAKVHDQSPYPMEAARVVQVSEAGHSDGDTPPT